MRRNWKAATLACLGLTISVSGCAGNRVDVIEAPLATVAPMPPLPADLAVPCPPPSGKVGQDARVALARTRGALKTCTDRHGRVVRFYSDVRNIQASERRKKP